MDFRSLSRRELQTLCKRNKIPANITNVAMADALAALPSVEGMEEFLNSERSGVPESPMKGDFISSEVPRTELRTSTRRKVARDEPITARTRRAATARGTEESENRDLNVALTTPSLRSGRRRTAGASSACKKVDFQMTVDVEEEDNDLDQEKNLIENTPAMPKSQKRVVAPSTRKRTETRNNGTVEQRAYSTRRSVRLLEQNMESLSLAEDEKMEPITVHMSLDDMPNSSGPVKEGTELEVESKKTNESESKLDEDLGLEIDGLEKNEMESAVELLEKEVEIVPDDPLKCPAESLVTAKSCDDSETEAPDDDLDVKCFSDDEASKDDDSVQISAEEINDSDKLSLTTEDVDLTEVHHSTIVEESSMELESKQNESICDLEHIIEEVVKPMNISAEELSLPIENLEEETQVDDVLSSVEESVMEVKDDEDEYAYESEPTIGEEELDADIEGDKNETEMEKSSVQAEEVDTIFNNSMEFPENVSEHLVDVKIQWQMEESPPKDINIDAIDSHTEIPNDILQFEEALVEVSVTSTEEILTSFNNNGVPSLSSFAADQLTLANQFPRPSVVETKSPLKEQTPRQLMNNSDSEEEEEEKEQEKANCIQRQTMEKNDMSLRQLRKMFKEQLQLNKKKMDNNNINTKVIGGGGGQVRTALQPLPENRMAMDGLEKLF